MSVPHEPISSTAAAQQPLRDCPTCSALLCEHLTCRVCGTCEACDTVADIKLVQSLFPSPSRTDQAMRDYLRKTVCVPEAELDDAVRAMKRLASDECLCVAGNRKRHFHAFCRPCYQALTPDLKVALDRHVRNGYLDAWRQALGQLRQLGRVAAEGQ